MCVKICIRSDAFVDVHVLTYVRNNIVNDRKSMSFMQLFIIRKKKEKNKKTEKSISSQENIYILENLLKCKRNECTCNQTNKFY